MYDKWILVVGIVLLANIALCIVAVSLFQNQILSRNASRILGAITLLTYVIFVLWYAVFGRKVNENVYCILMPLSSYWQILLQSDGTLTFSKYCFSQVALNWLLLAPLGSLLPLVWPALFYSCGNRRGLVRCVLAGFSLSLLTEILQLSLSRGFFEVDDIINNTLGCVASCLVFRSMLCWQRRHMSRHVEKE